MINQRRWLSIAFTNFLGIFNDNAYKCVAIVVISAGLSASETQEISSLTSVVLFLPFVLFSFIGGYLSDNFPRHRVIIITKFCEIFIMFLGAYVIIKSFEVRDSYNSYIYIILFIMAFQSTIFSPTRSGIMPQLFSEKEISSANGSIDGFANVGIILAVIIGVKVEKYPSLVYLLPLFSIIGYLTSLFIPKVKRSVEIKNRKKVRLKDILTPDIKSCLFMEIIFYTLSAAILTLLFSYTKEGLFINDVDIITNPKIDYLAPILLALTIGLGIGCIWAGKVSKETIELGLILVGIIGMFVSILILSLTSYYYVAVIVTFFLGMSCGFYIIPVRSYLQYFSDAVYKGRILGLSNTLSFSGMVIINLIIWGLASVLGARDFMLIFCVILFLLIIYILSFMPKITGRFLSSTLFKIFYRFNLAGVILKKDAVLLLPNHITWVDGSLLSISCPRPITFSIAEEYYKIPIFNFIFRRLGFISIPNENNPKEITKALKQTHQVLENGGVLCIFPKELLTKSSALVEFKGGYKKNVTQR